MPDNQNDNIETAFGTFRKVHTVQSSDELRNLPQGTLTKMSIKGKITSCVFCGDDVMERVNEWYQVICGSCAAINSSHISISW